MWQFGQVLLPFFTMRLFYGTAAQRFDEGRRAVKSQPSCSMGRAFWKKVIRLSRGYRHLMLMRQTAATLMKLAGDYQQEACSTWPWPCTSGAAQCCQCGWVLQASLLLGGNFSCGIYLAQVAEKKHDTFPPFLFVAVSMQTSGPSTWPCYTDTAANSTRS